MKRNERLPLSLSSSTSEPRISAGIRSGVHWTRFSSRPRIVPSVSTRRVLARPGTPINSACPPHSNVIWACSITVRWPKMISPIRSRTRPRRRPTASTSATRSAEGALRGKVEFKPFDPLSKTAAVSRPAEHAGPGNSSAAAAGGRPPVDRGDLGIRIARDGFWYYRGSPILRLPLVKLFASVLRREADGSYWLVTPAEGEGREQQLIFRTNLDEIVTAGPRHPLRVATAAGGEPAPYILVREALEAKLTRAVFYELVERGVTERIGADIAFGVWSGGAFFRLGAPESDGIDR